MKREFTVKMNSVEYESYKKWRSLAGFSMEKLSKTEFYELVKDHVPDHLLEGQEIFQQDSLETFVEEAAYCVFASIEKPNITFDLENLDCSNDWSHVKTGWDEEHGWLAFMSGGDWEIPVFGILYFDGVKLKCYVPEKGNCYDPVKMTAWQEEPPELEGKSMRELYDLELMTQDIRHRFNLDEIESASSSKEEVKTT